MRLYNVVDKYYHTIIYATGKHFIVAINKYKDEFQFVTYFKSAVVFILSSTAGSSCCSVLCIFHLFLSNNRILHCFTIHSHCMFAINAHKGKWENVLMKKKYTICLTLQVPLVQSSPKLYCYLTVNQCQEICTVFISDYVELHIDCQFSKRGVI